MYGLTKREAEIRLKKYGLNELSQEKRTSLLLLFLSQFTDVFSILLILAVLISALLYFLHYEDTLTDAILILLILFMNGSISTFQQWKAEEILSKLRKLQQSYVTVIRDGKAERIDSRFVTVGDAVVLEEGLRIPADGKIVDGGVSIDESTFTGESFPVEKGKGEEVWAGTFVVSGKAIMIVEKIGNETKVGELSKRLREMDEISVFKEQLNDFSFRLLRGVLVAMFIFFAVFYIRTHAFVTVLLASIALVVAVVPEGLPMVAAITMMHGVQRLAKNGVLVRKLESVEALGAVEYVVFDKTGTLTKGSLEVDYVSDQLKALLPYFILPDSMDPVERAIDGWCKENNLVANDGKLINVVPFNYKTRRSSTLWKLKGKDVEFTKGAPEVIFELTKSKDDIVSELTSKGIRVIAFAMKKGRRWKYVGVVGFKDPIKDTAKSALEEMKRAHLIPIMITGDHENTARAIAKECGIKDVAISGEELRLNPGRVVAKLKQGGVVFRAEPEDKLLLVEELKRRRHIIAATGDGVNDVLLLKRADVGIAMGNGTDIAKEAADIILLKDDLLTIVRGIIEGRTIITNVRKFVTFLLSCNIAEVVCAFALPFLSPMLILDAPKLLWVNLLSDGLPATTFAFDDDFSQVEHKKPKYFRSLTLPFMERVMLARGFGTGLLLCVFFFFISSNFPPSESAALFFSALALGEVLFLFVTRYLFNAPLFSNKWMLFSILAVFVLHSIAITYFYSLFKVSPLSPFGWLSLGLFLLIDLAFNFVIVHFLKEK